jgi:hypothetical protein
MTATTARARAAAPAPPPGRTALGLSALAIAAAIVFGLVPGHGHEGEVDHGGREQLDDIRRSPSSSRS